MMRLDRTSIDRRPTHGLAIISQQFSLFSVAAGVFVAAVSFYFLNFWGAAASCALGWTMLAIAVSDAQRYLIPDILSLPAIPAGIVLTCLLADRNDANQLTLEHVGAAILAAALLYGVKALYFAFRRNEGLGLGDVKLGAVAGAWTGLQGSSHVLLLACISAMSYVMFLTARQKKSLAATSAIPLGVFLAPAIWIIWFLDAAAITFGG